MTKLLIRTEQSSKLPTATETTNQEAARRKRYDMKRVPWYAAMLCRLGIHPGKWVYVTDGNCSQLKACGRCDKTRVRTKHQRQWQYIYSGLCEQMKVCQRCRAGAGRHRIRHVWDGKWGNASERRECLRCGKVQTWDNSPGVGTYYD